MEKISLHNYEAWFLDYIEGNLGTEEVHDLFAFLELHPELKEELAEFELAGDLVLEQNSDLTVDRASLKFDEENTELGVLSLTTVENWMIASVEGLLSKADEKALSFFITEHHLEQLYKVYQSTRLVPSTAALKDKEALKQKEPFIIPLYAKVLAIAASFTLLIGLATDFWSQDQNSGFNGIADTVDTIEQNKNIIPATNQHMASHKIKWTPNEDSQQNQDDRPHIDDYKKEFKNENLPHQPEEHFVEDQPKKDSTLVMPQFENEEDPIVEVKDSIPAPIDQEEDDYSIAFNRSLTEEPLKIVTEAVSNVFKTDVAFMREKDLASGQYTSYQFKFGSFAFERKRGN